MIKNIDSVGLVDFVMESATCNLPRICSQATITDMQLNPKSHKNLKFEGYTIKVSVEFIKNG